MATDESMLKLKIRAVHFGGLVPRVTDQMDFLDLLASQGIHNIRSYAFLKEQESW